MTYDDIINLPHYVSKKRPQMSMENRAAQFSPFAALVGYESSIAETNRQVEQFVEFDENYLQELDEKLQYIQEHITEQPFVEITYFVLDEVKSGGAYKTIQGKVKKIDNDKQLIIFTDKHKVELKSIVSISRREEL